jgi:hypothetical protein
MVCRMTCVPGCGGVALRLSRRAERVARYLSDLGEGMKSFWNRDGEGQHEAFLRWLDENPGGFFLNCRTASDMMLHRSPCPSQVFHEDVNLARNRKVCSLDRDQLVSWAARKSSKSPRLCSICAP